MILLSVGLSVVSCPSFVIKYPLFEFFLYCVYHIWGIVMRRLVMNRNRLVLGRFGFKSVFFPFEIVVCVRDMPMISKS